MQLYPASIGSAVPRENFNATIQSVFDSSLNLRLARENRLITILISDHYDLPQGIRLERRIPLQYLTPSAALCAHVGLRAACRGGVLRFDSSPLTIDLRGAPVWDGHLHAATMDIQMPATEHAWSTAWRTLNRQQRLMETDLVAGDLFQAEAGPPLTRRLSQPILQLIAASARFDVHATTDAAKRMIGLGPGVTPSGDDVLIGFLAGLHSTADDERERQGFIYSFGEALSTLAKDTNEISRTYLNHAIQGEFSSSIVSLMDAIRDGEEEQLLIAIHAAMRVGHSSGMDSVTGLLMGLCVWNVEHSFA